MSAPLLELRNFSASLGGACVLREVDFAASSGEFVAICGPNGAGKSTLLRALAGLLPGMTPQPRARAYLPQGASCGWPLTIAELAALGRLAHGDHDPDAITAALADCGVAHLAARRIDQVSGGQARRAHLARAFATRAPVLLLDEPVADLDPAASAEIMALLARFAAEGGLVVAVLHALDLAARYASRICVVAEGRMIADGPPAMTLQAAADAFGMRLDPAWRPLLVSGTSI